MKNKSKKGFTLIELLAVIVILAVIALIATPIILGIVEDARRDAFLRSVELLISTTDLDVANKNIQEGYTYEITDGTVSNLDVGIKNTKGMNGEIIYNNEGKEEYTIHNGVYCVKKTADMEKAAISDYVEGECTLEDVGNYTSEKCFAFSNGTITDYYDYEDNDASKSGCPKDVIIPKKINGEKVTKIGDYAFGEKGITNVDLKNLIELEVIGVNSFYYNKIISIKLPDNVKSIGNNAFQHNKLSGELDLSHLTSLETIGSFAFYGSSTTNQITSIKLPSSVTSIEGSAFSGNKLSGELDLSNTNITTIGNNAFVGSSTTNQITSIKLPSSVTSIESSAFSDNKLSGELDLSNTNITSIGQSAFSGSSNGSTNQISSLKLPSSITSIGNYAFRNNKLSGKLDLSNLTGLTSIGTYAFQGNSNGTTNQLSSLKLPSSVTSIGQQAFQYNKLSGELDLSNTSLTSIAYSAFGGTVDGNTNQITSLKLPSTITSIGASAFLSNKLSGELDLSHLTGLTSIGNNAFYGNDDGSTNQITSIKLPSSVTSIGQQAFQYNKLSGELDLSNTSLTSIGLAAFVGSNDGSTNQISSLKLPSSVTSIGQQAFQNNKLSGELDLSHLTSLKTIDMYVFQGNYDGSTNQISSLKIPSSVTKINGSAFQYNALTSVTFYGRSDLTGITIASSAWGWATGCDLTTCVEFVNEE